MRRTVTLVTVLLALGAALIYGYGRPPTLDKKALYQAGVFLFPQPRELPDAHLSSPDGQPFGREFFAGKWTLVLFGYTFCPDVCPTALSDLRKLNAALPPEARSALRVTMVSVDPHRDTPEILQRYVTYFDPTFTAMSGALSEVQKASGTMGLPFIPGDMAEENYTVTHSGNLALIDPSGVQRGFVRGPFKVEELIRILPALMASQPG
ncbi:SCO family protein [Pseudomonas sp. LRF_L74]|uniref:SCO family protein n=1 Tax=Pseudomonas sp. LRF_L74 TaxID=3369422 RepID=UPI003F616F75